MKFKDDIIKAAAERSGFDEKLVERVYSSTMKSLWHTVMNTSTSVVSLPHLGKLFIPYRAALSKFHRAAGNDKEKYRTYNTTRRMILAEERVKNVEKNSVRLEELGRAKFDPANSTPYGKGALFEGLSLEEIIDLQNDEK